MQALSWHPPAHACGCRQQLHAQPLPAAVGLRSLSASLWQHHRQQQPQRLPLVAGAASGGSSAGGQEQQQQRRGLFSQQQPQDGNAAPAAAAAADEDEHVEADEYDEDEDEGEWDDEDEFEDEDEDDSDTEAAAAAAATPGVAVIPPGQTSVPFTPNDFVEVGRISRPHGIRGEVKVQLITDEPKKRLGTRGKRLWLKPLPASSGLVAPAAAASAAAGGGDGRLLKRVVVESGRVARLGGKGQRAEWAVKFEGVNTREQAATLAGNLLLLALCDREARPRGKDEFFVDQLVGLKAVDAASGALLGVVTEVYESGSSYSLLRLRLAPDEADIAGSTFRSLLLPFVAEMVPAVDVGGGSMQVDLPEGMLETAGKPKQLKRRYTPEQQAQLRQQLATRLAQQAAWEEQQQKEKQ